MSIVVIIGGGPAGMAAAIFARERGACVALIEKNEKLGKKLYITGKGRCNITNTASIEDTLRHIPRGANFMRSALSSFDSVKLIEWIESLGVPLNVERGGRVFPASDKASDITRAMSRKMERLGVEIMLNAKALGVVAENGSITGVRTRGKTISADCVIVATGGLSYPATGSTGDGYAFARSLAHNVSETSPALVPLLSDAAWVRDLAGLSLEMVGVRAMWSGKRIMDETGDMLFTHSGVSGPLILTLSSKIPDPHSLEKLNLFVDLKSGMTPEQVDKRLMREFAGNPNKLLRNLLRAWLPAHLAEVFPVLCGFDSEISVKEITKQRRAALTETLKNLRIPVTGLAGYDEAIITRGGVCLDEINPKTMQSKLVRGLYFAGEVMDVDCLTGGYNLTCAISTGVKAGMSATTQ